MFLSAYKTPFFFFLNNAFLDNNNMEFNNLCSSYYNNETTNPYSISPYSEPFNDIFTDFLAPFPEPSNKPLFVSPNELSLEPPLELPAELTPDIDSLLSLDNENNYQYNLAVENCFDDWSQVDTFMHQYCLERGFEYQICRNDKDPDDPTIIRRKSFRCSSSGNYRSRKKINQNLHRLRGTIKTNCEWHVNFTFPKTSYQVKCTTLKNEHNHEINPAQVPHIISRYRRLNNEMVQDLRFFSDCKVAPIIQLEILKKKYPEHVFHKQDIYNAIYKLRQDNIDEKQDSVLFLDILLSKMTQDPRWKVFIRHSGNECRLSGVFWMSPSQQELYQRFSDILLSDNTCKTNKYNMYLSVLMVKDNYGRFRNIANALIEDELSSTYVWILQCLAKATNNIVPKSIWTDSEPGLINAISQVFPNTPHFYCLYHIWQNVIKNLKGKLGENFYPFSKAFYLCRNALSVELFEIRWKSMISNFPECERYMNRTLYANRISWAKAYMPFHFNAGIQSTQGVESFNAIIKRAVNSASTLCDIEKAIDKRHQEEAQYCQLTDIKAKYTTIGLPHLSSQFFSSVDLIIAKFLPPLILSLQRFQISQSFTYEGQLVPSEVCIYHLIKNYNIHKLIIFVYFIIGL